MSLTLAVLQPAKFRLKAAAESNMSNMLLTEAVFQPEMSPLNRDARLNAPDRSTIRAVFHDPMGRLNADAEENICAAGAKAYSPSPHGPTRQYAHARNAIETRPHRRRQHSSGADASRHAPIQRHPGARRGYTPGARGTQAAPSKKRVVAPRACDERSIRRKCSKPSPCSSPQGFG